MAVCSQARGAVRHVCRGVERAECAEMLECIAASRPQPRVRLRPQRRRLFTMVFAATAAAVPWQCAHAAASQLPGVEEQHRALECQSSGGYLDFSTWTDGDALPRCVSSCDTGTAVIETAGAGDVPSCVWPKRHPLARLRFDLHEWCRESQCTWFGQWDLYRQMVSVQIAKILGVPLSEVQSAFLYWLVADWPAPPASPVLQKFLISRKGEADFPEAERRRLAVDDPWYVLHLAFRVDSRRIELGARGINLLQENSTARMNQFVGIPAEVHRFEFETVDVEEPDSHSDFAPVYKFRDYGPNEIPGEGHELGGVARPAEQLLCLDPCYAWDEIQNASRCRDDCECNGARWCSHLGGCTGDAAPCRSDGVYITTTRTTSATSVTSTATASSAVPTSTTAVAPLLKLGSECKDEVVELWRLCDIGTKSEDECDSIACAVVNSIVRTAACEADICNVGRGGQFLSLDYWLQRCPSAESRESVDEAHDSLCISDTTAPPDNPPAEDGNSGTNIPAADTDADSDSASSSPAILIACGASGLCLSVCLARACKSPRVRGYTYDCVRRCAGSLVDWKESSSRNGRGKRANGKTGPPGAPVRASTMSQEKAARHPWLDFDKWRGASKTKVADADVEEDEEEPEPHSTKSTSSGGPSEASAGTRQAWSEAGPHAQGAQSPGASPGPRAAASATPVDDAPRTESEALLFEMRRLRQAEHSAAERRRFFRENLLKWHPDKNIGNEDHAAEMFKVLQDNKGWFLNED